MLYDQLYVDTRDARIVHEVLHDILDGLAVQPIDESPELGLSRWAVTGVCEAAKAVRSTAGRLGGLPDLELLRTWIEMHTRDRYSGWVPAFDWNYDDGEVETSPHVKVAIGDPEPVTLTQDGLA